MSARGESTQCSDCPKPGILPENREPVDLFMDCLGLWRYRRDEAGHDEPMSIDRLQAKASCKGFGFKWRRVFPGLKVMEAETIKIRGGS